MKVVSDTSPVGYLVLIDQRQLIAELFGGVILPAEVAKELLHPDAPRAIREWIRDPPPWLVVDSETLPATAEAGALSSLHAGERAAILLAERLGADLVLLDDRPARRAARERGLRVTGLLGLLREGARLGLVDLAQAIEALRRTNFRASPRLLKALLEGGA